MDRHPCLRLSGVGGKVTVLGVHPAHVSLGLLRLAGRLCLLRVTQIDCGAEQEREHVLVQGLEHGGEQIVALQLVNHERVLLLVCRILHGLPEVVHVPELLLPVIVDLIEYYGLAEGLGEFLAT